MPTVSTILEEARLAAHALAEYAGGLVNPTVRLRVTGLTRAGKTVFMTAPVHNLFPGGRPPGVEGPSSRGGGGGRPPPPARPAVPRFARQDPRAGSAR